MSICIAHYAKTPLMAVSLTVYAIFSGKNSVTLKTRLGVVQGYWNWHRSMDHIRLSISLPL